MTDKGARADNREVDITMAVSCYNEENLICDTLDNVVEALKEIGCTYEVIVFDDVSRDNSVLKIQQYIKAHPDLPIRLKANVVNRGLGYNYIDTAFSGKGKYYRLTCGDDGETKDALVKVLRHIGRADIIIPYYKEFAAGKSRMRNLLSKSYSFLVNLLSGYNIHYYNGLAVHLRHNVMRWPSNTFGFGFQADIITRLLDEGASYLQVQSEAIDRKGSFSTALSMRNIFSVLHTFIEIAIRRMRNELYGRKMPVPIEVHLDRPEAET